MAEVVIYTTVEKNLKGLKPDKLNLSFNFFSGVASGMVDAGNIRTRTRMG